MKVLALIPARGGSKQIPRKNVKQFAGKPLIAWTIDAALAASGLDRVIVSTDDPQIAETAESYGAEVPFMRPAELGCDNTPTIDVALHVISQLPDYDWLLILQPTSPLRTAADINGIKCFSEQNNAVSVVSVSRISQHPFWMYKKNSKQVLMPFIDEPLTTRRQDLPALWVLNGSLYFASVKWLIETQSLVGIETLGYETPEERSQDIDSENEWEWAEAQMLSQNRNKKHNKL